MTHAPGMSAYNYVERRMAPLSRELAGLILPHDAYGSHLNASGKTVDADLERMNLKKAGDLLAEIWSEMVLDGHGVTAEYVENASLSVADIDEHWCARHCRVSQYLLQIVKCELTTCCAAFRTSWMQVFPDRFLPAPLLVRITPKGPVVPETNDVRSTDKFISLWQRLATQLKSTSTSLFAVIPYDLYCPTLQLKDIRSRICRSCSVYMPSAAAVNRHRQQNACVMPEHGASEISAPTSDETKDYVPQHADDEAVSSGTGDMVNENEALPVFHNIFHILKSPWEDL